MKQVHWRTSLVLKETYSGERSMEMIVTDAHGTFSLKLRGKAAAEWVEVEYKLLEVKADGSRVQSVLCSRERFKTLTAARKWCRSHKFKTKTVGTTKNFYRFRQFDPGRCAGGHGTITLTKGVKAHVCIPK